MDMQMCMKDYPDLYGNKDPMDVEEDEEDTGEESKKEEDVGEDKNRK